MILCTCEQFYGQRVSCFRLELQSLQLRPPHLTAAVALQGSSPATLHCQVMAVHCKCAYLSILVHTCAYLSTTYFHKVFRHIVKKKEKVPSFPGFCIKYCAGLCSTLTVCRFPVSFVAHSCLLCHALHIAQRVSALLDARRSHRHKYGRPHIWPVVSPHTLQVSHETAPDFLNGGVFSSMDMFFPQRVLPGTEMTGGDLHLKEREIRNCPRSLNFPPNIRENPPSSRSSRSPHFFHGNWSIIWADSLQRSNMLK